MRKARLASMSVLALVLAAGTAARAAGPSPAQMRSGSVKMDGTGGNRTEVLFDVPEGKTFVLTDFYFATSNGGGPGVVSIMTGTTTRWQAPLVDWTKALSEHWTTGIVFTSGTNIVLETANATNTWNFISWSGYLVGTASP